jgi:hypothetical protein
MMNAKSMMLLAAMCLIRAEPAVSTICKQATLDGDRVLTDTCADGSCAYYQVGSDGTTYEGTTDLGYGGTQPDVISFEFYSYMFDTPPATGTFDLGTGNNSNYATCNQCILILQDLVGPQNPQKYFFQTGGSITIDANTVPGTGADVGLSWSNVTLAEVTIRSRQHVHVNPGAERRLLHDRRRSGVSQRF